jgi:hypothetical protein
VGSRRDSGQLTRQWAVDESRKTSRARGGGRWPVVGDSLVHGDGDRPEVLENRYLIEGKGEGGGEHVAKESSLGGWERMCSCKCACTPALVGALPLAWILGIKRILSSYFRFMESIKSRPCCTARQA